MADSFEGLVSDKLRVVRDTHNKDTKFNSAIGEDFGKMTYPAASIIPDATTYQNDLEYGSGFVVRYVFSRGPTSIDWIQAFEDVETATDTLLENLSVDTESKEFKPTEFQPQVADNQGSRLSVVEVTWQLTDMQDFA